MRKWWNNLKRWFRRTRTDAEYALLFHKVSRRLGNARARARQSERDAEYLADQLAELRRDITGQARALADAWRSDIEDNAAAGMRRRCAQLESECAALNAECISLRAAARMHRCNNGVTDIAPGVRI